jgi:hypothetical protein
VKKEITLNMTAKQSEEARKVCVDLVKEGIRRIKNDLLSLRPIYQKNLAEFLPTRKKKLMVRILTMPRNVNWKALKEAYEFQPRNYEELIGIKGIGPATIRGLALVSEVIYGTPASWRDPCKFAFCVGGKDGVPYPIKRKVYDRLIVTLGKFIKAAEINERDKLSALKRLASFSKNLRPI